jgi:hypothetical protein
MGQRAHLRRIGAPVVAGPPSGVRIRTRIHVMEAEAAALSVVGSFLGGVYRVELAGRVRAGHLDRPSQAVWRAERKQAVTVVAQSPSPRCGRDDRTAVAGTLGCRPDVPDRSRGDRQGWWQ